MPVPGPRPLRIRTPRLELVASDAELAALDAAHDHAGLARRLAARVPDRWPPPLTEDVLAFFADKMARCPEETGWWAWMIVRDEAPVAQTVPPAGEASGSDPPTGASNHGATRAGAGGPAGRVLIGGGGFKGPPGPDGEVEIGYSILPAFQRRGYATEAMRGLMAWGFADPRVTAVAAETFPELEPSLRVIAKLGLTHVGPGLEAGTDRFAMTRAAWQAQHAAAR
ncbi:MAG: GNAT family N-acetyltransferase [Planctomycetota bacterium]